MTELVHQSAVELARSIRSQEVTATEVVSAHLDRIDQVNGRVNAIVSMRSRKAILADAAAADAAEPTGALHGLPVAVKDLQHVAGIPTRSGSEVTSSAPAAADGLVAERLRAAGAIIIGKTNTPEFGTGSHTFNTVFGTTLNPWDLTKSAGGSSGGAAAALASRMLPIADGSDLGGSLRNPAAFCNVVGLRPSIGRVPVRTPGSTHLIRLGVEGPMGRTVADTALMLSVLAGPDPLDPLSLHDDPAHFADPLPTSTSARVAWAGDMGRFTCETQVLELCRAAAAKVSSVGGTFLVASPDLGMSMEVFRAFRGVAYRYLGSLIPAERHHVLKATVRENIAFGQQLTVDDLLRAEILRGDLHSTMTSFFQDYDILALPSAQVAPFPAQQEFPTKIEGVPMADYLEWMTTCCIITASGCPAISIPAGFTTEGLPVGLQLVAPVGRERFLLEVASAIEAANPCWTERPPLDDA